MSKTNQSVKVWIAFVVEWLSQFMVASRLCVSSHLCSSSDDLCFCDLRRILMQLLPERPAPGWAMRFYQTASDRSQERRSCSEGTLVDSGSLGRKTDTAF